MSDPDGDSQMRSSSSSSSPSSEAMFPSELDPPGTTITQPQLDTLPTDDSSFTPPQSQQDPGEAMDTAPAPAPAPDTIKKEPDSAGGLGSVGAGEGWMPQSEFAKSAAEAQFEPGASWNNKKARDEYQRAWAQIEDKGFSLKEFGDPFDESELGKGGVQGKR